MKASSHSPITPTPHFREHPSPFRRWTRFRRGLPRAFGGFTVLVVSGLLLAAVFHAAGTRWIVRNDARVSLEFREVSEVSAQELADAWRGLAEVREVEIARRSPTGRTWMAIVSFRAESPKVTAERLRDWLSHPPGGVPPRVVRATFSPWRIHRPGRGDILPGSPIPVEVAAANP